MAFDFHDFQRTIKETLTLIKGSDVTVALIHINHIFEEQIRELFGNGMFQ